jgi:alkylation response protein AidB-like acyl-CoA dehydrogenase
MSKTDCLKVEPQLHAYIRAFLPEELPLSGKPIVGNETDAEVVVLRTGSKRQPEFGGGADPPAGGGTGLGEQAAQGTHLAAQKAPGPSVIVDTEGAGRSGKVELILEDVRLPENAVLPGVTGMRGPLSCLNEARYGIVWGSMGAARACFESALEYSKTRVQFDRPIGGFQLTQRRLVDMAVELNKGLLVALHIGRMKDEGRARPEQVSFGKLNNVREALEICREARGILGANGVTLEYPVIRHMNNLESVITYEGTSEVHTLILGKTLTGLDAFE